MTPWDRRTPWLMAEIGVNHDGGASRAHELIDGAADAGFDAVKFQYWIVDELLAAHAPVAEYQGEGDQRDLLDALALTIPELRELAQHANQRAVTFVCTADGDRALGEVLTLEPSVLKIGSGDSDNPWLLDATVAAGLPTLISTGMTSDREVEQITTHLRPLADVVIMHCVSAYPTPLAAANLHRIPLLARATGRPVGFSDHTLGVAAAAAALALGARVIEKHVTWSVTAPGPDHSASLAIGEAADWVSTVRQISAAVGPARESSDEAANKPLVRKGLYAARDLAEGARVDVADIVPRRPLLDGIPVLERSAVVGRRLAHRVAEGALLHADDLSES